MHKHFGLIARLAREYRLSGTVEDELTRLAENGASAVDIAARALKATERDTSSRPPAHVPPAPASYSAHDAPEVLWDTDTETPANFGWGASKDVLLPPVK